MRIGIDARLWHETGVGRYIRNLVKYLQVVDKQHEYVLFVKEKDVVTIAKDVPQTWRVLSTNAHWHSFQEQASFPLQLYKENLDLMHFPYFSLPILYNRPFVITVHDLIIHHFSTGKASTLPLPLYKMKRLGYQTVLQQAVKRSRKIIVPLAATKHDLMQSLHVQEQKIVVTYEGVDESVSGKTDKKSGVKSKKNTPSSFQSARYFLYVGNAYPHKNLKTLLAAFQLFKQKYPGEQVQLFLVGKEDYFYAQLREGLKRDSGIHIFHNIGDDVLHDLYTYATAVVAPSFMEGFGLVPLEALASDCLVIASDIPSHREVCGEAAVYFDPHRPEDLLYALENVYRISDAAKKKISSKARERLQQFSWKTMATQTAAIYEESSSVR